jgi:L-lactate dehydrogenase complex protein LldF
MRHTSAQFVANAHAALNDAGLQPVLNAVALFLPAMRAGVMAQTPDFEAMRDYAVRMKDHTLEHLDSYLADFEARVSERGGHVHHAATAADLNRIVTGICRAAGARRVIKGKSMVGEETALNDALEAVETDLGEYIVQLAGEAPSHIIAPAVHKTMAEVEALFAKEHGRPSNAHLGRHSRPGPRGARGAAPAFPDGRNGHFRRQFPDRRNRFGGAGHQRRQRPHGDDAARVHVVITGIEKIVPTLEDLATLMRLLPRSATGQAISNYVSLLTGTRRAGDHDGPRRRSSSWSTTAAKLLGSDFQDMLRCIRCGACMNHCPVYFSLGGHAYGWVYPGPMGSVLTPLYTGIETPSTCRTRPPAATSAAASARSHPAATGKRCTAPATRSSDCERPARYGVRGVARGCAAPGDSG